MKRLISEKDEKIFRACHHDFNGLSVKQAAEKLGLTVSTVQYALRKMAKKIPSMFPILTPRQKHIYDLLDGGMDIEQVAELTGTTESTITSFVTKLHKKGCHLNRRARTIRYEDWMGSHIREKF